MSKKTTKILGHVYLKRHVITEKYSIEKEKTNFLLDILNGCEIYTKSDWPGYTFYHKNNTFFFAKNDENKRFYVNYPEIWSVFEAKYGMDYASIKEFIQSRVETLLKTEGFTTKLFCASPHLWGGNPSKNRRVYNLQQPDKHTFHVEDPNKN